MKMNMKTRKLIEYIIAKIKDLVSYFFYYFPLLYVILIFMLLADKQFRENASQTLQFYLVCCFIIPAVLGGVDFLFLWLRKGKEVEYSKWLKILCASAFYLTFFFNLYLLSVYE